MVAFQANKIQGLGQENPSFGLSRIQLRHHQEFTSRQRVSWGELCPSTRGQEVSAPFLWAPTGKTIRIGRDQQGTDVRLVARSVFSRNEALPLAGGLVDAAADGRITAFPVDRRISFLAPQLKKTQSDTQISRRIAAIALD